MLKINWDLGLFKQTALVDPGVRGDQKSNPKRLDLWYKKAPYFEPPQTAGLLITWHGGLTGHGHLTSGSAINFRFFPLKLQPLCDAYAAWRHTIFSPIQARIIYVSGKLIMNWNSAPNRLKTRIFSLKTQNFSHLHFDDHVMN